MNQKLSLDLIEAQQKCLEMSNQCVMESTKQLGKNRELGLLFSGLGCALAAVVGIIEELKK